MATFLLRRLLLGILTLLVITCFVYGLARAMPGTPLTAQMGEDPSRKLNPEDQERLRRIYGLPQKEVAARLGIAEHTVEAQATIGLRKLAEFFERLERRDGR